jgi:hypothetical protein
LPERPHIGGSSTRTVCPVGRPERPLRRPRLRSTEGPVDSAAASARPPTTVRQQLTGISDEDDRTIEEDDGDAYRLDSADWCGPPSVVCPRW